MSDVVPRAILDSDVIFSRVLHELMGRIAASTRAFDLIWSDELLAEAKRVLIEYKPLSDMVAEQWVDYMRASFPEGRIDIREALERDDLSDYTRDPDDHHVVALALAGPASYLFTFDRGYRRQRLADVGVAVPTVDSFLIESLAENESGIIDVLERQLATWGGGSKTMTDLIDALERARAPRFAQRLRAL